MASTHRHLPALLLAVLLALCLAALPGCDSTSPAGTDDGDPGLDPSPTYDEDGAWTVVAPLPEPLSDAGIAAYRDGIYVVGGTTAEDEATDAVRRYDPAADAWTELAPLPGPVQQAALVVHLDTLFLIGGNDGSRARPRSDVLAYDADADAWLAHSRLPGVRDDHGAVSVQGRIFVFGGDAGGESVPGDSSAIYGPEEGWSRGPPPPVAHQSQHAYGVVGDVAYAVATGDLGSAARMDAFDPGGGGWLAPLSTPVSVPTFTGGVYRERLHVLTYSGADRFHRVYDRAADTWLALPPMPSAVRHTRPVELGGRLWVVGGVARDLSRSREVRAFSQP